jgi:asparagine synthase (glutamine-hydrolysing)
MCGIVGLLSVTGGASDDDLRRHVAPMCDALRHRGPDAAGLWVDASLGIALGQRRLAVVDLTPSGAQPMVSASGRSVIVYNGECYELDALRRDVERAGPPLRGTSDTEVVLEACERLGLEATLSRLVGMFAFALLDRPGARLHLVRDRVGIKPLYVTEPDGTGTVRFASETRALRAAPGSVRSVDPDSLARVLLRGHLPSDRSIHAGVRQLRPGTVLTLAADGGRTERVWWSLGDVVRRGGSARAARGHERRTGDRVDALEDLLGRAVGARMVADVPLGAFLSGGIDSSVVVALMQERSSRPVRTFSIGSTDPGYDESTFARVVAEHLGTDHTELILADADVVGLIPAILDDLDEPLADPSFVPTWLVSRLARRDVTVALSGDGGDEVFGGYTRHRVAASRMASLLWVPAVIKAPLAATLGAVPPRVWDALAARLPADRRPGRAGEQVHKAARVLAARDMRDLHRRLVAVWENGPAAARSGGRVSDEWGDDVAWSADDLLSGAERMMLADTLTYLPGDVLAKVDRASMAHSLEVRVPLLDHRVIEEAWRAPLDLRIHSGRTKWLLREVLARRVPTAMTDRPKRGFAQPVGAWLRGPLRGWAEDLLSAASLDRTALVRVAPVHRLWHEHLSGRADHHAALWAVLVVQAWATANRIEGFERT